MTEDFYKDLIDNPILLNRMDTSNLPRDHPCYVGARARIPGLFKDETGGEVMSEFIALRAKSYSYKIDGREAIVAKGIRGHVVRNHLTLEDHKRCLFENDDDDDDDDDVDDADYDFGGGDDEEWKDREMKRCALSGFQSVIKAIHQNTTTNVNHSSTIQLPPYTPYTPYRVHMSIRSFKHQVKTIKSLKMTLNRFDDKRVVSEDRIHTLAYGHYKLRGM
ncbi:DNA pol B 2 domain-containing protein [Aphis craccivora]|uniref:DNA pol B 2 domain-containing protein n=1 Tax=Aphis craccivora TaxID=307492 RepID=A0A6G0VMB2_APHCR|nr:DNA pol B 2 domain-containing protein [Aphis craccivora]